MSPRNIGRQPWLGFLRWGCDDERCEREGRLIAIFDIHIVTLQLDGVVNWTPKPPLH